MLELRCLRVPNVVLLLTETQDCNTVKLATWANVLLSLILFIFICLHGHVCMSSNTLSHTAEDQKRLICFKIIIHSLNLAREQRTNQTLCIHQNIVCPWVSHFTCVWYASCFWMLESCHILPKEFDHLYCPNAPCHTLDTPWTVPLQQHIDLSHFHRVLHCVECMMRTEANLRLQTWWMAYQKTVVPARASSDSTPVTECQRNDDGEPTNISYSYSY